MPTINISLPEDLKKFVEETVKNEGYGNTSEFFRELLRARRKLVVSRRVQELLTEGLNSGPPIEVTDEFWNDLKRELVGESYEEFEENQ